MAMRQTPAIRVCRDRNGDEADTGHPGCRDRNDDEKETGYLLRCGRNNEDNTVTPTS